MKVSTLTFLFLWIATGAARGATMYVARAIVTMDGAGSTAEAVAVEDGRIVAVGTRAEVEAALRGKTHLLDERFARDVILPGFIDPHAHLQNYGVVMRAPYIGYYDVPMPDGSVQKGARTPDEVLDRLRAAVAAEARQPLIFAFGADPIYFGGRHFTAAFLDQASSTKPIVIELSSGHVLVCNTPALRLLEQTKGWETLLATRGVVKDAYGKPTGELDELAAGGFAASVFAPMRPDLFSERGGQLRALREAGELVRRGGVTTATDLLVGFGPEDDLQFVRDIYATETAAPAFPVRVVLYYYGPSLVADACPVKTDAPCTAAARLLAKQKQGDTEKLRTGGVKFVMDGSVQGYTGQLLPKPGYWNGSANPIWNIEEPQLVHDALPFWKEQFQIRTHVNGDGSVEALLSALATLQKLAPWRDHRTTFEHVPVVRDEQYRRIAAANAAVDLFTNHIYYWGEEHNVITLGPERAARLAPVATAKSLNIPYGFHSDAPVTPSRPLFAVWCAVNRETPTGGVLGPNQRVSALDALRGITSGAAYLLRMESEIGSIEPGKRADFTVLAENPLTVPPRTIKDIPIRATVLGGRVFD